MSKTQFQGIDVSKWNGAIQWDKVKPQIDFAILRIGYGAGNIDPMFKTYAASCNALEIPIGGYWFSYAYTEAMAIREADYAIDYIQFYHPEYPIFFDFEYDSETYAMKHGVAAKDCKSLYNRLIHAFCKRVEERGYYASNYCNKDYFNRITAQNLDKFDIWFADYSQSHNTIKHNLCQYTSRGKVSGIPGFVDMNVSNRNYPEIIKKAGLNKYVP